MKCGRIKYEYIQDEGQESVKWSEVMGIWTTEEIEYLQEQGLENDKWSEVVGIKAGWDVKCIWG